MASIGRAVNARKPMIPGEMTRYPWRASRRASGDILTLRRRSPRTEARRGAATLGSCSTSLQGYAASHFAWISARSFSISWSMSRPGVVVQRDRYFSRTASVSLYFGM